MPQNSRRKSKVKEFDDDKLKLVSTFQFLHFALSCSNHHNWQKKAKEIISYITIIRNYCYNLIIVRSYFHYGSKEP